MLDDLEKSFDGVSENTKKNYTSFYNRLLTILGTKTVIENSNKNILDKLKELDTSPNSIKTFITVIIRIKKNAGVNVDDIIAYRNNKLVTKIEKYQEKKNEELNETLSSYDELQKYMRELLNDDKYKDYIINYLLINYGVRNNDINLLITNDKSVLLKKNTEKKNYLYYTKRYIIYQRNDYKTVSTYGRKSYKIINLGFRNALSRLLGGKDNCNLLFDCEKDGDINIKQIGNRVLNATYNNLGESKYFKILIKHYKEIGDIEKIRFLSQSRGTDLQTIFNYYDINST